jgi:hypothetical protein
VLLVALLAGVIKYDMQRTAASQPATRAATANRSAARS